MSFYARHCYDKKSVCFLLYSLLFVSCYKIGIKDNPIPVEQIFGMYDLGSRGKIILNNDFSYVRLIEKNAALESDTGVWRYKSYKPTKTNVIQTFDKRVLSEDGTKKYYTAYKTNHLCACKHWGKIVLTNASRSNPVWYKKGLAPFSIFSKRSLSLSN